MEVIFGREYTAEFKEVAVKRGKEGLTPGAVAKVKAANAGVYVPVQSHSASAA